MFVYNKVSSIWRCIFIVGEGMSEQEICKDLAYSYAQLQEFLSCMQGVVALEEGRYTYGNVGIRLVAQEVPLSEPYAATIRPLPRCNMYLQGEEAQVRAFYERFMIYHMTMGG